MKKLLYIIFGVMGALMFIQCSDWTEMEPKFTEPVNINGEDYYKALREYKKSDHPIVFGWYSEWTGTGTNMNNQLRGIPDSMDIVSLWGGAFNLTEAQKSDLKEVREKKGLRVLYCQHITDIGRSHTPASVENDFIVDGVQYNSKDEAMAAYWGWYGNYGDTSEEGQEKAIRKYARVLMVDGEPQTLNKESGPLLDYYVVQAYYCRSDEGYSDALDGRFDRLLNKFGSIEDEATILSKTVWCEDFEKHKGDGGPEFTTRDGIVTYSLKGMAMYYRPGVDARIGGVGAYRFNLCRPVNDYFFMREVIQVLNPANH